MALFGPIGEQNMRNIVIAWAELNEMPFCEAQSIETTRERLLELAHHDDWRIRAYVAANVETPDGLPEGPPADLGVDDTERWQDWIEDHAPAGLCLLANDVAIEVVIRVASNCNAHDITIQDLTRHHDCDVAEAARVEWANRYSN
jgi:hypothetical protein